MEMYILGVNGQNNEIKIKSQGSKNTVSISRKNTESVPIKDEQYGLGREPGVKEKVRGNASKRIPGPMN